MAFVISNTQEIGVVPLVEERSSERKWIHPKPDQDRTATLITISRLPVLAFEEIEEKCGWQTSIIVFHMKPEPEEPFIYASCCFMGDLTRKYPLLFEIIRRRGEGRNVSWPLLRSRLNSWLRRHFRSLSFLSTPGYRHSSFLSFFSGFSTMD